ncbi:helix-turn-helix domain-containing protein [Streptomyces sp. DSM 42041]|uniref:Helix-turn-helix domain-containing protein n=1 Tax=Streptomyces hazeniae TaxID=3075538 RepID=A0ABU2P0X4_9ACTN|nr:helix-turn-helix domain-containing protein [Streptomyces sp. DSM 42041]MDT0382118.1 helix-turn-helix domain-containing protein [Streptomyces sp. DSM 42041]
MGWWQVGTDALAGSRFTVSPLAETTGALTALARGAPALPAERAWLDAHLPAYRKRLAADPVTAELVRAALGRTWIADFLARPPLPAAVTARGTPDVAAELPAVRDTPPDAARADLAVALRGPLPPVLAGRDDLPGRAADLLEWVWAETVRPYWSRRRRVLEADVLARTDAVSRGGWAAALDGMGGRLRWLGRGRLRINAHDNPPRRITDAELAFVPVTARHGWVAWRTGAEESPARYAVVYPCAGLLAEPERTPPPEALGRLLGPGRAAVLVALDSPKSTTHLVALTGLALGSVGRHLRVLLDARLVGRRRAGRSVLYFRTPAGDTLVAAQRER